MRNQTRRKQRGGVFNNTRAYFANKAKRTLGFTTARNIRNQKIFHARARTAQQMRHSHAKMANVLKHAEHPTEPFEYSNKKRLQQKLDEKIKQIEQDFQEKKFDAQAKEIFNKESVEALETFFNDFEVAIQRAQESKAAEVSIKIGTPIAKFILGVVKIAVGFGLIFIGLFVLAFGTIIGADDPGFVLDFAYNLLLVSGAKKV